MKLYITLKGAEKAAKEDIGCEFTSKYEISNFVPSYVEYNLFHLCISIIGTDLLWKTFKLRIQFRSTSDNHSNSYSNCFTVRVSKH